MATANERILCVDDQQEIHDLLTRHLGDSYELEFAFSGAEALQIMERAGPFGVIIADYSMPNMDGVTLLREVHERAPDTARIMLTAFDDIEVAVAALHKGSIFRFLRKPWEVDDLKQAINDGLDQYRLVTAERHLTRELERANAALDTKVNELKELNQLLEYWVEFSPAVLYSSIVDDGSLRLNYVSKNFAELSGHERTAMIVDPGLWYDNIHPEDRDRVAAAISAALNGAADRQTLQYRCRHRSGDYRPVLDSFRVIRNTAGDALEVVGAWMTASQPG
ncbi:MAG: response regulator, partial [Gammaproteobacteria bacterium]|nr:response regulator [Gammaproteobacteria bacterium]